MKPVNKTVLTMLTIIMMTGSLFYVLYRKKRM